MGSAARNCCQQTALTSILAECSLDRLRKVHADQRSYDATGAHGGGRQDGGRKECASLGPFQMDGHAERTGCRHERSGEYYDPGCLVSSRCLSGEATHGGRAVVDMTPTRTEEEKRLSQLKKEVPIRGFERHPLILKQISDLPPEFRSPAVATLADREPIQTIIAFPSQIHRGWHYVPKQALLFTPTEAIHLLASIWPDQEPQVTHLRGSGLLYMQVSLVLLYGYLEIAARGQDSPTRLSLEFNTVAWYLLSPPLRRLLQAGRAEPRAPIDRTSYTPTALQTLERLPLKFSNGLQIYGLLPGEELEEIVFQPGTRIRWSLLLRQPVPGNTLLLLTSNYMVVIREDLKASQGWIISYVPRDPIRGILSRPRGPWNELTVLLRRGDQTAEFSLLLKNQAAQEWRAVWIRNGFRWEDQPREP